MTSASGKAAVVAVFVLNGICPTVVEGIDKDLPDTEKVLNVIQRGSLRAERVRRRSSSWVGAQPGLKRDWIRNSNGECGVIAEADYSADLVAKVNAQPGAVVRAERQTVVGER
jgi:hypothetical protein